MTIPSVSSPTYLYKKPTLHIHLHIVIMTDDPTPTPPSDTTQLSHPILPFTTNIDDPTLTKKAPTTKINTKKLRLPHPCIPDELTSLTNKWSATTHPIKAWIAGYYDYHISYKHFFFHQSRVLLTKAFTVSTTASIVGDGGIPKGSTEIDAICGSNCAMDNKEFDMFAQLVLGRSGEQYGTKPNERSFVNMLLEDLVVITNLTAVFDLDEPNDRRSLARRLARCSLLLLGADALTPKIIASVWGENEITRCKLGGSRGDLLAIVRR